jgi:uncharacterized protein YndB with AHSA1/START domain
MWSFRRLPETARACTLPAATHAGNGIGFLDSHRRNDRDPMNAKAETQSILAHYDLLHPPAKVWRVLTEPALLAQWLMLNDMRPIVGHRFTFTAAPTPSWNGTVRAEVLEVVPHERLSYTWDSGSKSVPSDTVVTWTLTPTLSAGTRLTLEHSGFPLDDPSTFEGARNGWQCMVIEPLRTALAGI